jgi:hypothetical protein
MSRNTRMMIGVVCFYLMLVFLTTLCAKVDETLKISQPTPKFYEYKEVVRENEGQVCFEAFGDTNYLRGIFFPRGCWSSSCTQPIEQSVVVELDAEQFTIRFYSKFVLLLPNGGEPLICTDDCEGAGTPEFDIGKVERGRYSIWLGDTKLGELSVPKDRSKWGDHEKLLCFGERW